MEQDRLSPTQFEQFRTFIYAHSGIRIQENKVQLLTNRIRRRLKKGDLQNFDDYYRLLTSPAGVVELESFLDAITTNETFFFRTEKHFDWLKTDFVREMVAQRMAGSRPAALRIWSAGCANGAEPYSIAICLAENRYRLRDWSLTVFGSDISEEELSAAREGVYRLRHLELMSERQLRRCFRQQDGGDAWQVRPNIRDMVQFQRHNLMQPLLQPAFDCIFIRNVLIYFDRDSKQIAINNILRSLVAGGYLVVGPSEGISDLLKPLHKISPLLYQKIEDDHSRACELPNHD